MSTQTHAHVGPKRGMEETEEEKKLRGKERKPTDTAQLIKLREGGGEGGVRDGKGSGGKGRREMVKEENISLTQNYLKILCILYKNPAHTELNIYLHCFTYFSPFFFFLTCKKKNLKSSKIRILVT